MRSLSALIYLFVSITFLGGSAKLWADPLKYQIGEDSVTVIGCDHHVIGEVIIPPFVEGKPVTAIGRAAFTTHSLVSIFIPETITKIDQYAFVMNQSLKRINVSEKNLIFSSIDGVLMDKNIKTIILVPKSMAGHYEIPEGIIRIGRESFSGCSEIEKIIFPDSVEIIETAAFNNCYKLESIILPKKIKKIDYGAFHSCKSIKEIIIPDDVEILGDALFYSCENLRSIRLPSKVTKINMLMFSNCINLESISPPLNIKVIEDGAFSSCLKLSKLNLGSEIKSIGGGAFANCQNLKSFNFGNSLLEINSSAFSGCVQLKEINLPVSIERIGGESFYNCRNIEVIEIPANLTNIGMNSFTGCYNLKGIHVDKLNPIYRSSNGILYKGSHIIRFPPTVKGDFVIPENINFIRVNAFSDCVHLTGITIHGKVSHIADRAFFNCRELKKVTLLSGIQFISNEAFFGCSNLYEFEIPESVLGFDSSVLGNCYNLKDIKVDINNKFLCSVDGVLYSKNKKFLIKYPEGKLGRFEIPSEVKTIKDKAFKNAKHLIDINMGNTVAYIGSEAFYGCSNLKFIKLPNSIELSFIVTENMFGNCENLQFFDVDAKNKMYSVIDGVLFNKDKNSIIQYPSGREGDYALPYGVTSVGSAFMYAHKLSSIALPSSIKRLPPEVFKGCKNLKSIIFKGNAPSRGKKVFDGISKDVIVYVEKDAFGFGEYFGGLKVVRLRDLEINSFKNHAAPFSLSFETESDSTYKIEASHDFKKWGEIDEVQGNGGSVEFTDWREALFPKQYYRVKLVE